MFRAAWRFSRVTVALVVALVLVVAVVTTVLVLHSGHRASSSRTPASTRPDVVFVHGAGCGAIDYTYYAMKFEAAAAHEAASTLHTVGYYACDTSGDPIENEGSSRYLPSTDGNGLDTSIQRIAYELAWYLWNHYGSKGQPVDLVGHSMGGVVITYALQRIAAHDPNYPKSLTVPAVIAFSSPLGGVRPALCTASPSQECTELLTGSPLMTSIEQAGAVGVGSKTVWTLVGSDGADEIPSSSSLALPGAQYVVDYALPRYVHTAYLTDASVAHNAAGTLNGKPFRNGLHSLALMASMLR